VDLDQVLDSLLYRGSPNFLSGTAMESDRDFGHAFRRAQQAECKLRGVYVCEAKSDIEARQIHRRVWNQNELTFESLQLNSGARAAVEDLGRVQLGLVEGKPDQSAVRQPSNQVPYGTTSTI